MTKAFRTIINATIQSMEAGRFQDFCLDFLPIYSERFIGLERFGHTAAGKTRGGTPDLLKTNSSGANIAVQCGTEQDYWIPPKNLENWKPIKDTYKCIAALSDLTEIVLISNQELSTKYPNAKNELANYLKEKTSWRITPITLEEISQFISSSIVNSTTAPKLDSLTKEYFPEVYEALSKTEHAQKYQIALEVSYRSSYADKLIGLINKAFELSPDLQKAKEYVIQEIEKEPSYRLSSLPKFDGVKRNSIENFNLKQPLGRVWVLTGVPKIGKTHLLLQLTQFWTEMELYWYDYPWGDDYPRGIVKDLIKSVFPQQDATQLLKSPLLFSSTIDHSEISEKQILFIVDNADKISTDGLSLIAQYIQVLKIHKKLTKIGFIFTTNTKIQPLESVIDETLVAPSWSASEIEDLLKLDEIEIEMKFREQYLELLHAFSGGHPMLARTLARRYPLINQLVEGKMKAVPGLEDETLSKEIAMLLYNDILTDPDSQNFVQRLSVIAGLADEEIMDVLRTGIQPVIATSSRVIIDKVGNSVIEGSQSTGYYVALVFKEIAKQKISNPEQVTIYRALANKLLTPEGKTLYADRVSSGIFYAILSQEFQMAYFWTTMLVWTAYQHEASEEQIRALLSKLSLVAAIPPQGGSGDRISHGNAMMVIAMAYHRIGESDKAIETLRNINLGELDTTVPEAISVASSLNIYVKLFQALWLAEEENQDALRIFSTINHEDLERAIAIPEMGEVLTNNLMNLTSALLLRYPLQDLSQSLVKKLNRNGDNIEDCFKLACDLGIRAYRDGLDQDSLNDYYDDRNLDMILKLTAKSILLLEQKKTDVALEYINRVIEMTQQEGIESGAIWAKLHQIKADAAYIDKDDSLAGVEYKESLKTAAEGSFEKAWASWRIGLINNDEKMLESAALTFRGVSNREYWARATGARGALLISNGNSLNGIRCFEQLFDAYFFEKIDVAGPATTVAVAHLARRLGELRGNPIPASDTSHPEISPGIYTTVLDIARPRIGPITAYYNLSEAYELLGDHEASIKCIRKAVDIKPEENLDQRCFPLLIKKYLDAIFYPKQESAEIKRCLELIIECESYSTEETPRVLSDCVFNQTDQLLKKGGDTEKLSVILNLLDDIIQNKSKYRSYWEGELLLRRARILEKEGADKSQVAKLYYESFRRGENSTNRYVISESAHALGFKYIFAFSSMRELAEIQYELLKSEESGDLDAHLTVMGENLFNIWRQISYRRLYDTDLRTNKYLMSTAKEMDKAAVSIEQARYAMITLLARLFKYDGPCVRWSLSALGNDLSLLPEQVVDLIRSTE